MDLRIHSFRVMFVANSVKDFGQMHAFRQTELRNKDCFYIHVLFVSGTEFIRCKGDNSEV